MSSQTIQTITNVESRVSGHDKSIDANQKLIMSNQQLMYDRLQRAEQQLSAASDANSRVNDLESNINQLYQSWNSAQPSQSGDGGSISRPDLRGIMESRAVSNLKVFDGKNKFRLFSERLINAMDQARPGTK